MARKTEPNPKGFKLMPTRDALDRKCHCIVGPDGDILKDAGRVIKFVDQHLAELFCEALETRNTPNRKNA
jgi:hypothetical protein